MPQHCQQAKRWLSTRRQWPWRDRANAGHPKQQPTLNAGEWPRHAGAHGLRIARLDPVQLISWIKILKDPVRRCPWHFFDNHRKVHVFPGELRPPPEPAKRCSDLVNGLECRLQNTQVIFNQAPKFQNFFLDPNPELFPASLSSHFQEIQNNAYPLTQLFFTFPGNVKKRRWLSEVGIML